MSQTSVRLGVFAALFSVVLAACGGGSATTAESTTASTAAPAAADDGHSQFAFGEPGVSADADRVIDIIAGDDFRFDPGSISVTAGETVTFRVINTGVIPHDFTVGDEATQQSHAEQMAEMTGMAMPDEPNAIVIGPGETRELTWHFTEPGSFLIGCHQAGHYEAGMMAEVHVEG